MIKGSITIYLSIVITLVLGLVCTVVESGRVSAIKAKTEGITYMAMDSEFSEYARQLFEDYGLMFLWETEADFTTGISDYAEYNCDLTKGILSSNADFYGIGLTGIEIRKLNRATDNGGRIFAEEVGRYMKYAAVENILETILAEINIFDQGGTVRNFYDKIKDFSDRLTEVEEKVGNIKDKIDQIQTMFESPDILLDELISKAEGVMSKMDQGSSYSTELTEYQQIFDELKSTKEGLMPELLEIQTETSYYYNAATEAAGVIQDLNSELNSSKDELDQDMYKILEDEVNGISEKATINDTDYYGVKSNETQVTGMISYLREIGNLNMTGGRYISEDNIRERISELTSIKNTYSGISLESLGVNFNPLETEKDENSIIDYIDQIVEEGILGFIVEDPSALSEAAIQTENLPSVTSMNDPEDEGDGISQEAGKIIYSEYLLSHFGNYLDPKENTGLQYELEYIISGKDTDKENLSSTATKIMLLREGCNFIYLLKDGEKRNEAYEMAMALVGFTGMPLLVTITQFLILGAWAMAESIVDVKNLLKGDEVSIIKSTSEWNLSLMGAKNLSSSTSSSGENKPGALNYQQYLRMIILMENKTKLYFRTMDIIQVNICKNYNSDFRMADCISSAEINATYGAKPLFTIFPFVKKLSSTGPGTYPMNVTRSYSY